MGLKGDGVHITQMEVGMTSPGASGRFLTTRAPEAITKDLIKG